MVNYLIEDEPTKYVQSKSTDTWHWCTNCHVYPKTIVKTQYTRPRHHLCNHCKAKEKEDNATIHSTIKEILREKSKRKQRIPSLDAVKDTLKELMRHSWVEAKRGRGYWLSDEGRRVLLMDLLHAFGEDIGTAMCCRERNKFHCPYRMNCRAHRFHKQLSSLLGEILEGVTIEDIVLGTWQWKHRLNNAKVLESKK